MVRRRKRRIGRKQRADFKGAHVVDALGFVFGLVDSFFAYVLSSFFAEVIGSDNVGPFYLVTFAAVFALLWSMKPLVRRIGGGVRTFYLLTLCAVFASALLSVLPVGWISAMLAMLLLVATNLAWVALDVVLEEFSEDGVTGRVRGLHLTVMNAGIMLAPFFSTQVLQTFGFEGIFFGLTLGYSLLLAASIVFLKNGRIPDTADMEARSAWRKMLREPNLFHIYGVSFALEFFYVIMIIYTPIHLRSIGFSWEDIGLLFTVMLLPFVLLQYPLGILADRRFGEKEFLVMSIGLSFAVTVAVGLFSSQSLFFWGVLLFLSRVGAAGIEVLRDAYFYKQIDGNDDDLIAFFRTARPAANIVGALLAIPLLWFFPLQGVFFLASAVLLAAFFSAFALEDTPVEADYAARRS
ncbi:MAG: MFS transporter [Candidatus Moranbacteria bacterium]|nr:MFS transporter [Candidatus Moranbacteria bacterium]NTW45441.1 MFS transporter [Candidatus Moranbacteria bacterium]